MSPLKVFVAIWVLFGIVLTVAITLMLAAMFLTWLWKGNTRD